MSSQWRKQQVQSWFLRWLQCVIIPFIWQYAPTHIPETKSLLALIYTVFMASLLAMFCYFKLVQNIKATTLSLTTVMTPMIAMFFRRDAQ